MPFFLGLKSLDIFLSSSILSQDSASRQWALAVSLGSPLKYLSQNYHMLLPHDIESMIRIIPLINLLQIYFLWCCGQLKMLGRFLHEVGAYNKLYENVKYLDHFVLEEGLNSSFFVSVNSRWKSQIYWTGYGGPKSLVDKQWIVWYPFRTWN